MDILHIYKDYYPVLGGIENHVRILSEAQAVAGHQVTVLVCDPGLRTRVDTLNGVRVIRAGRLATVASMPISLSQPVAVARQRPDVAHVHSPYPLGEVANWFTRRARATVITHHSDVVRQRGWLRLYGPLLNRVLRDADRIIATSPRYIETSPWLRQVKDRCTVVPLGVDLRRFTPAASSIRCRSTLFFFGRLRYYKGLDTLLRALPDLPLDVNLTVGGDGPMREPWEQLAATLGVTNRVRFLGTIDESDLPSVYRQASLFVLPANARAEAFGTVLLEAMASGVPCVTTEVGTGTSWVVKDGITGRVIPPRDPTALAQAIRGLLDDTSQRRAMGTAARARAEREFSQELMIARVLEVYREAVDA